MTPMSKHSAWGHVFFPAIAMLLGWGLRGYIGGGPFGALIPGCYVALSICLLLGYRMETTAIVALFTTIGIGYGGDMTYGQTLSFLSKPETIYWGLTGCLVKGGVWGLFGGALLGIGLTWHQYERRSIVVGLLLTIVAFYIGIKFIDEPKLIYFSNRIEKPREESWAGLLFAAIALLVYLRGKGKDSLQFIPFRFALWGILGGALGFGGGALWLAFGPRLPFGQEWIGWWKAMEFSFGFVFGAALGYCAYLNRDCLQTFEKEAEPAVASWTPVVVLLAFIALIFIGSPFLEDVLPQKLAQDHLVFTYALKDIARILTSFVFFGAVVLIVGQGSILAAWQVAVTLTFFHTVFDFVTDLSDVKNFGYTIPIAEQLIILFGTTLFIGFWVHRLQRGPNPIVRLFLLAVWSCYIVSCARSFLHKDFLLPPPGENVLSILLGTHKSLIFVQGTFTISAIITTWFVFYRFDRREESEG